MAAEAGGKNIIKLKLSSINSSSKKETSSSKKETSSSTHTPIHAAQNSTTSSAAKAQQTSSSATPPSAPAPVPVPVSLPVPPAAPVPVVTTYHWIQCENIMCEKWRRIPQSAFTPPNDDSSALTCLYPLTFDEFSSFPFFCSHNPDLSHASCCIEEEHMEQGEWTAQ